MILFSVIRRWQHSCIGARCDIIIQRERERKTRQKEPTEKLTGRTDRGNTPNWLFGCPLTIVVVVVDHCGIQF